MNNIIVSLILLILLLIANYILLFKIDNFNIQKKNLVFTSVGDNTNFDKLWCQSGRNYDIWVVYYGKNEDNYQKYRKKVDYIEKRKGSKFQNFHHIYNTKFEELQKYDRFFILDDDIIFETPDINKMFEISKKYNLDICGPTFKTNGSSKISHAITRQESNNLLRYTNFIEVNVPLFNRNALNKFMKYYDPILIGWGIDYLYIWALGKDRKRAYALVDSVSCINPHDKEKNGKRELTILKDVNERVEKWNLIKKKYKIPDWENKNWEKIPNIENFTSSNNFKNKYCIIRILGNNISNVHSNTQTYDNLKFTLENEPDFQDTDKIWILNRIYDEKLKQLYIDLLNKFSKKYLIIEFKYDMYQQIKKDNPVDFNKLNVNDRNSVFLSLYKYSLYVVNINGARNYALDYGRKRYQYTFVLDGSCIMSSQQFKILNKHLKNDTEYIALPMIRLKDNQEYFKNIDPESKSEPQLCFKHTTNVKFDERLPYGISNKTEMLRRLGIHGIWDKWLDNKAILNIEDRPKLKDPKKQELSSIYRLSNGTNKQQKDHGNRTHGIYQMVKYLNNI